MTLYAGPEPQYALLHSSSLTAYQSDMLPVRFSREDSDAKVLCKGVVQRCYRCGFEAKGLLGGKASCQSKTDTLHGQDRLVETHDHGSGITTPHIGLSSRSTEHRFVET